MRTTGSSCFCGGTGNAPPTWSAGRFGRSWCQRFPRRLMADEKTAAPRDEPVLEVLRADEPEP